MILAREPLQRSTIIELVIVAFYISFQVLVFYLLDTKTILPDTCVNVAQARYFIENHSFQPLDPDVPFFFQNIMLLIVPMSFGLDPFLSAAIIQFSLNLINFYILLKIFRLLFQENAILKVFFSILCIFFQYFIRYQFQLRQESVPITIMIFISFLVLNFELNTRPQGNTRKEMIFVISIIFLAYFVIFLHYLSAFFCFLILLCYTSFFPRNYPVFKIFALILYPICILLYWTQFFRYFGLIELANKLSNSVSLFFSTPLRAMILVGAFGLFVLLLAIIIKKRGVLTRNKFSKFFANYLVKIKNMIDKRLFVLCLLLYLGLIFIVSVYYAVIYALDCGGIIANTIQNIDIPVYLSLFTIAIIFTINQGTITRAKISKLYLLYGLLVVLLFSTFYIMNIYIGTELWQFRLLFPLLLPAFIIAPKAISFILVKKEKNAFLIVALFSSSIIIGGSFNLKRGVFDDPFNDYMTRAEYSAGIWIDRELPGNRCLIVSPNSRPYVFCSSSNPDFTSIDSHLFDFLFGIDTYNNLKSNPSAEYLFIGSIQSFVTQWNAKSGTRSFYLVLSEEDIQDPRYKVNYWMNVFDNGTYFERIYELNTVIVIRIIPDSWI